MDRVEEIAKRLHELYWDEFLKPRDDDEVVRARLNPEWPMNPRHKAGLVNAIQCLESEGMIIVTHTD